MYIGCDGITQAQLAAGTASLTEPLMKIFNKWITEGEFPKAWKEAIVTPVLIIIIIMWFILLKLQGLLL